MTDSLDKREENGLNTDMSHIGYRNEACFGAGVRDALSVIVHEICELGNDDILEYAVNGVGVTDSTRVLLNGLLGRLAGDDADRENLTDAVADAARALLADLSSTAGFNIRYALWLADRDSVKRNYGGDEAGSDVKAYRTSPVILSDLGPDGILFGYGEEPEPIAGD